MTELSGYALLNLICLGLLGLLGLRRLVRMERFHWPRVVILTFLLWVPAFYLFTLALPDTPSCEPLFEEPGGFTIME